MKKQLITIAVALLTAGALSTSCSSEDNTIETPQTQQPAGNTITLTATLAPKGDDGGTTRAITPGTDANSKEILNVAWQQGEYIAIYYQKNDDSWATAMATIGTPNGDGSAPFTATLNNAKGGTAKLIYPYSLANTNGELKTGAGSAFRAQDGTIEYISQNLDAATATATIDVNGGTATVTGPVTMQNQVCICKFNFSGLYPDATENYFNITIREKQGSSTTNTYMTTSIAKSSMGAVYMALLGADNKDFKFSVQGMNKSSASDQGGSPKNYYEITSTNVTLTAGKFYRSIPIALTDIILSTVVISDGETYTLDGATINVSSGPAIRCEGDATIILNGTNTVTASAEGQPAIFIPEGKTLTIQGTGSLTANATGGGGAGIGGGYQGGYSYAGINCGNIIIESGTITATGGYLSAGIGSGYKGTCGNITISGGSVMATGDEDAAGIGSGEDGTCGDITISGGTVTATGGVSAAGIGSGYDGTCGTITINGGTVEATGGYSAAGIGSGYKNTCGDITINGGTVTAAGGDFAAGIGSGESGTCGTITINGGTVEATGGNSAAGIGSGYKSTCGDITITSGVTSVTATKGSSSPKSIGKGGGNNASCGTVTIGGQTMYNGSSWTTTPTNGGTYGGLSLAITKTYDDDDTWTLTPQNP